MVTFLQNYDASGKLHEVGAIKINDGLLSSPDGMFVTDIGTKIALEAKASWFNGRGFPFSKVPWGHYIQVMLEMVALGDSVSTACYVSWSPLGTRMFEVKRHEPFCIELLQYLQQFYADAAKNVPFAEHNLYWSSRAEQLGSKAVDLAKYCQLIKKCESFVDIDAKRSEEMQQIIKTADDWHQSRKLAQPGLLLKVCCKFIVPAINVHFLAAKQKQRQDIGQKRKR